MKLIDLFTTVKKPANGSATSTTTSSMVEVLEGRMMMSVTPLTASSDPTEPLDPVTSELALAKKKTKVVAPTKVVAQDFSFVIYVDKASPVLM